MPALGLFLAGQAYNAAFHSMPTSSEGSGKFMSSYWFFIFLCLQYIMHLDYDCLGIKMFLRGNTKLNHRLLSRTASCYLGKAVFTLRDSRFNTPVKTHAIASRASSFRSEKPLKFLKMADHICPSHKPHLQESKISLKNYGAEAVRNSKFFSN